MKIPKNIPVHGDTSYRGDCPSESAEQITFFAELRRRWPDTYGRVALHVKNEGRRYGHTATRDKLQGLSPGAADIIIPGAPTFCCELKRANHTKSRLSTTQIEWLEAAQRAGATVCVALGWQAAMAAFEEHIK